jgi:hypothetical protein
VPIGDDAAAFLDDIDGMVKPVRDEVRRLVARGQLPNEDVDDEPLWVAWEQAVRALQPPATNEEALAVLDVFPQGEDSAYGLAWSILHFAESAPDWPVDGVLDDRSPWVVRMRERCERAR